MDTREGGTSLSHWPPLHVLLAPPHLCFPLGGILSTEVHAGLGISPQNANGSDQRSRPQHAERRPRRSTGAVDLVDRSRIARLFKAYAFVMHRGFGPWVFLYACGCLASARGCIVYTSA